MMMSGEGVSDLIITINKDNSNSVDELSKLVEGKIDAKGKDDELDSNQTSSQDPNHSTSDDATNKVFTVNDIQTLLDNQMLHKSQLDQTLENNKLEQQPLILLTNGDKFILIQNSSLTDNQLNAVTSNQVEENATVCDTVEQVNDEKLDALDDEELLRGDEMPTNEDVGEDKVGELNRIKLQHKTRQQSLMLQLERLKEKHTNYKSISEDVQSSTTEEDNFWEFDETNEFEKQRSNHKSISKRKSIPIEKFCCEAKWYPSFCYNLEKAHSYVRRRSENVEQLSKYFTTTSYAFESRCAELKKHLKKLELNLERFQNVLGKDLHFVENKLKNFFQDYHLEQFQAHIEEEDQKDLENCSNGYFIKNRLASSNNSSQSCNDQPIICDNSHCHQSIIISNSKNRSIDNNSNKFLNSSKKIKLVTPPSITITPTNEVNDEIDPVPEIRDVECDASLEEMGKLFYSNTINSTLFNKTSQPPPVTINIRTKKLNRKSLSTEQDLRPAKQSKKS